jgi:hypothetical protein
VLFQVRNGFGNLATADQVPMTGWRALNRFSIGFLAVLGMTISEGESKAADKSVGPTLGQNALASSLKFQCVDGRPERSLA